MEQSLGYKIGERMKAKRKALHLTQEDVERLSGVPQGTISRLESGKADDPQVSTLRALALTLQMSTDELLDMPAAAVLMPAAAASASVRAARRRPPRPAASVVPAGVRG